MNIRIFGHYVSLPLLLLMLAEGAIHAGAVYLAATVRFLDIDFHFYSSDGFPLPLFPRAALYASVMLGVTTAFGLYSSGLRKEERGHQMRFLASFPTGAVVMAIVFYAVPESTLGRGIMALSLLFSFVFTALARVTFFRIVGYEALKRRVLVLGTGSRATEVEALLEKLGPNAGFQLVGYVQCGDEKSSSTDKHKVIGDCRALHTLAELYRVDEIVIGVRNRRNGHLSMSELLECRLDGVSVVDLPTFFERECGRVQLNSLNASWMIYSEGFSKNRRQRLLKRIFDICASGTMLILASPIMLLTALAIWLETSLPILYRQKRVGECGEVFDILKFRSMRVDAEKDGVARWAEKDDVRTTRVGKFIRLTRIDELPQLINVLRGNMSFVGPRPERPPFVGDLNRKVPFYSNRHSVKPGITGWAQINYPYGASIDDAVKKLQFDLYYVKNHSLFLDLVIIFQTAQVVLFGKGAR